MFDPMMQQRFTRLYKTITFQLTRMSSRSMAKAIDLLERWYILLEQEIAYQTVNYLSLPPENATITDEITFTPQAKTARRSKLFTWMYHLVDKHDLDRELVAIAASFMDRFLYKNLSINRIDMQLVGMTSLYVAIKLYRDQGKYAGVTSFAGLSRGVFSEQEITKMEWRMLNTLDWRMSPPTVFTFTSLLQSFIPRGACSPFSRRTLIERIRYLLELSITLPFFLAKKPSNIAIAAFLEIIESEEQPNVSEPKHQAHFKRCIWSLAGIDSDSDEVTECRNVLKRIQREASIELKKQEPPHVAAKTSSDAVTTAVVSP